MAPVRYKPWEYQSIGIEWILSHPRCALFWEMGLGKSVVTLTALQRLIDTLDTEKALIIAPKKVAETTWTTEAQKWQHLQGLRVVKVMGTEKQRVKALEEDADVYVIGRDSFVWLMGHFNGELPFDTIVIDELTSFKTPTSRRFKAMRMAQAKMKRMIGLTGTPAPNGLIDLWAQIYCLDGGKRLGPFITRYRDTYFHVITHNHIPIKVTPKPGTDEAIRAKIADICLSMQAKDYLTMPPLLTHTVEVKLPPSIEKQYKDFEREKVLDFKNEQQERGREVTANSAAGLLNKLSQFSNGAVYDENRDVIELHGEKLDALAELIEAANGESVLVFYQYKHDIPRIMRRLKGYNVRVYEGEQDLNDWNAGKIDVLLTHPASTAYGLNMQAGGHYIVWYSTGWDLELYQQANARLHRQGQTKPVTVYKLVCAGTVDERASAALDGKQQRQQNLMDILKEILTQYGEG